jgi:type I restriction-modification system DNA methylase subunit
MIPKTKKTEFGDFQTPAELSKDVTEFVKTIFPNPSYVIEPTCGMGSFIHEAIKQYGGKAKYLGFDINKEYIDHLNNSKRDNIDIEIEVVDFFKKDWMCDS